MWVCKRSYAQISRFHEMVDVCGLANLGYEGLSWTYEKKVTGGTYYRVRLDWALASPEWRSRYPLAKVRRLTAAASDHCSIVLQWASKPAGKRRKGSFKYEVM